MTYTHQIRFCPETVHFFIEIRKDSQLKPWFYGFGFEYKCKTMYQKIKLYLCSFFWLPGQIFIKKDPLVKSYTLPITKRRILSSQEWKDFQRYVQQRRDSNFSFTLPGFSNCLDFAFRSTYPYFYLGNAMTLVGTCWCIYKVIGLVS